MRQLIVHGIGYAVVLTLAVGGTATALAGKNTVFSDDITNGEVRLKDLAPGTVKALQMPEVVPAGTTLRGTWGYDGEAATTGGDYRAFVQFPVEMSPGFTVTYVDSGSAPGCPGIVGGAPQADPANVCVYRVFRDGVGHVWAGAFSPWGFEVIINDDATPGEIWVSGVWAATGS